MVLRSPYPWFGGKSRAAALMWERLGDVANLVIPFLGSASELLARPSEPRIETVNDIDANVSNFWRAVQQDPDAVARFANWPVNEADLHARHRWLVQQLPAHRERMMQDPDYFDPKIAGWWVWGLSQWIGSGWCSSNPKEIARHETARPSLRSGSGQGGKGIHGNTVHLKRPVMGGDNPGRGVHRVGLQVPRCNGLGGQGVHGARVPIQLPAIGMDGWGNASASGVHRKGLAGTYVSGRTEGIYAWFAALQQRLRRVRVCCGDWTRIMGPSVIYGNGITGIILDPPYSDDLRQRDLYAHDDGDISAAVRAWAIEHGDDPRLRIILCGYEDEHEMPATWECVPWKANGGYGNVTGNENKHRERLWCSPHCLRPGQRQRDLFAAVEA